MANLFGNLRQSVGNLFDVVGTKLNLPEFGVSEALAAGPTRNTTGQSTAPLTPRPLQSTQPILGASSSQFGGGQLGGGQSTQQQVPVGPAPSGQGPQEQAPGQPGTSSIDALIQPVLDQISQFEAETRALLGGGEKEADAFYGAAEAKATQGKKEGEAAVAQAQGKAESAAEGAEGQQRRGFAELAKGLRSRFGSAVSTGLGAEAILGAETMRNIGNIRAGLQQTIQELNVRKDQLTDIFNSALSEAKFQAENLKRQARGQLQAALSEINSRRTELQTRRADMVNRALEMYRQNVIDINARNVDFERQIAAQKNATDESIRAAQARASNIEQNLPTFSVQPGETKFIPSSQLGGEGGMAGLSGTELPGGVQFGTAGQYGVFAGPEEESSLEKRIKETDFGG